MWFLFAFFFGGYACSVPGYYVYMNKNVSGSLDRDSWVASM